MTPDPEGGAASSKQQVTEMEPADTLTVIISLWLAGLAAGLALVIALVRICAAGRRDRQRFTDCTD
jgi:hypothetical protein